VRPAVAEGYVPGGPPLSEKEWRAKIRTWFPTLYDTRLVRHTTLSARLQVGDGRDGRHALRPAPDAADHVWFAACWMFASQKDGISAQSLRRGSEIGSYPTAGGRLHRLRFVLVHPGRDRARPAGPSRPSEGDWCLPGRASGEGS
jgi:hypothetical protein